MSELETIFIKSNRIYYKHSKVGGVSNKNVIFVCFDL